MLIFSFPFLIYGFKATNFLLNINLADLIKFDTLNFQYHLGEKNFSLYYDFFLELFRYELFRYMLLNYQTFEDFPVILS